VLLSILEASEIYLKLTFKPSLKYSNSNLNFGHAHPSPMSFPLSFFPPC
jgi:hypothetical protein